MNGPAPALIDSHVHVWDPAQFSYPWLVDVPPLDRAFRPADVTAACGAARIVFVQADCRAEQALDEARWVAGLEWPELAGIVAAADLRSGGALAGHLDALVALRQVVGVRHLLQDEPVERFEDASLREGLRMLAERGIPFDACVRHPQLPALAQLLEAAPDELRVVLDHLGKPPVDAGLDSAEGAAWAAAIDRLAARPDTFVKLSGLAAEASDAPALRRHGDGFLAVAHDAFGVRRSMLGSDWPVSATLGAAAGPSEWLDRVRRATGADDAQWRELAAGTATRFYGLAEPAG